MSDAAHRAKMKAKKERRKTLVAGFTPIPNKRIDSAIMAATLAFQIQGLNASEAHERARRQVASSLPAPRMVRSYRPRPSKSDDPSYRKAL